MQWRWRLRVVLLAGGAAVVSIGCRANRSANAGAEPANQYKAILHAAGTVVSVEEQAHDEQSYDLLPGPRVCFTIDSFAEVPSGKRNAYESAEREREAAHGPRCRDTSIDPSAVHIKPGDHVEVSYTLQNAGQISIVKVSVRGVDF